MLAVPESEVRGLQQAMAHYGTPVERALTYQVSQETLLYWQLVRRKRVAEVVLVLRRSNGCYLVHTKGFYPPGTYRLCTGGIKPGEDVALAVQREAMEETGLIVTIERFLGILHHTFTWQDQSQSFLSCVFWVTEQGGILGVHDTDEAITGYREVTLVEMADIADQLEALPPAWIDWGRYRASAHRLVVEALVHGLHG